MSKQDSSPSEELTHLDEEGRARMVNVGQKPISYRRCVARCEVSMQSKTLERIGAGELPKGDVLAVARIAGIQAAKRTDEWIPLAHPLPIESVEVLLLPDPGNSRLKIQATVESHSRTGVEMEALVAVSAAGLTVYDMCKSIDRGMSVQNIRLASKTGGKSGRFVREGEGEFQPQTGGDQ
ncbi:MAG: cyclic pyranopterin monophosphate synthase MoaC [Myxococcota bacterium]|nr:cyclic pyranopterin monophosphate synthase MoaC [Myxococcota bacterium]